MAASSSLNRSNLLSFLLFSVLLLGSTVWSAPFPAPKSEPRPHPAPPTNKCTNPIVRQEWRSLTSRQQQEYLAAVQCVLTKPSITNEFVAGAKSRYDDIVATHINQTFSIHYVGLFLPWHRMFTNYYESVLRNECGYTGGQPYWRWELDVKAPELAVNPKTAPYGGFDGSFAGSSLFGPNGVGGNGPWIPINTTLDPQYLGLEVPGRSGGGCVTDGAFKDMTVRMGPDSDLSGNPRCLSRDFSQFFANWYLGLNNTKYTIQNANNFYEFDKLVEGGPGFDISGIHGGGHYSIGGTLGIMGDLYNSPSDPSFWFHHSNLDRVWTSWQRLSAANAVSFGGPTCIMDYYNPAATPPQACPNATTSENLNLGYNGVSITVADVLNTQGDYLCYTYDEFYEF